MLIKNDALRLLTIMVAALTLALAGCSDDDGGDGPADTGGDGTADMLPDGTADMLPDGTADMLPDGEADVPADQGPDFTPGDNAVTQDIPLACRNSFTQELSDIPIEVTIDPGDPIAADSTFTATMTASAQLTQSFLQAAVETLPALTEVEITLYQTTITASSGATGDDVVLVLAPVPQTIAIPIEAGSDPPVVTGPVVVDLSVASGEFTADASGEVVFDVSGDVPDTIAAADAATPTHINARVLGAIQVAFACESGIVNDNGTPDDSADDTIDANAPEDLISFTIQ